jgi:hypothetical protein
LDGRVLEVQSLSVMSGLVGVGYGCQPLVGELAGEALDAIAGGGSLDGVLRTDCKILG